MQGVGERKKKKKKERKKKRVQAANLQVQECVAADGGKRRFETSVDLSLQQ
jgi:hypothetical protein